MEENSDLLLAIERKDWNEAAKLVEDLQKKKEYSHLVQRVCDLIENKVFNSVAWIDNPQETRKHPLLPTYEKLLDYLIKAHKADHITYSQRAALHSELHDHQRAVRDYEKYIQGLRKNLDLSKRDEWGRLAATLNHQAASCLHSNQLKKALKNLAEAKQLEPDNGWHWETEGEIFEKMGKTDRAIQSYEKASKLPLGEVSAERLEHLVNSENNEK